MLVAHMYLFFFFFNDTATTEIYTLSLHDALPIYVRRCGLGRKPLRTLRMPQALSALFAVVLAMQGPAPLRKSDLVRLLSGAVMSPVELAEMVRRTCLTFQPTDRDRNDFRLLGDDASLLAAVDDCGRGKAPRRTAVTPVRTTPRSPSAPPPPPPPPPSIPAAQPPVFQVQRVLVRV